MKKPIIFFLIVGLALVLGANTAQAISLDFSPVSQEVILGNQVVVDLMITGLGDGAAPSLGGFDLDVVFDPAILSFSSVVFGDQLSSIEFGSLQIPTPESGLVNLFELSFEDPNTLDQVQESTFVLASLTFDSIGVGTSVLNFADVILSDSLGIGMVDITLGDGTVEVIATTPVPEPATILLLAAGISGLGFVKRRKLMNS